jgi:hypothetical protein
VKEKAMKHTLSTFSLLVLFGVSAHAHGPDPTFSGSLWAQDQSVPFSWKSGQAPPTWMRPAILAAADDNNESRRSRAAVFSYKSGASSKVSYAEPSGCGAGGIACMSRTAPTKYTVAFRKHGKVFDWGTLRWCQKNSANGCYDVRNIMLDELGHVQILAHHVNYSSNSDYGQAVVQTVSRSKPHDGWNKHAYARCDVATLQKKYDMRSWTAKYSRCLDLDTRATLSQTTTSGQAKFVAKVFVKDKSGYGRLKNNPVAGRVVRLEKKSPGSTSWSSVGVMTPGANETYTLTVATPTATKNFRARFVTPDDEGLNGTTSGWVTIGP